MDHGPVDPNWPRLLALSVHELRNPLTVFGGYMRMVLSERAGPLSEGQRNLLEMAMQSVAKFSSIIEEMSTLSNLEEGKRKLNKGTVNLTALLSEAIAGLPDIPDREPVTVTLTADGEASIQGDAVMLNTAFSGLLHALRRELVTSTQLFVRTHTRQHDGSTVSWIAIADADNIDRLVNANPSSLLVFDEWRGGSGLRLAIARRVFAGHGGWIWSPARVEWPDGNPEEKERKATQSTKAAAVVMLPHR